MNRLALRAAIHIAAIFALYLSVAMLIPAAVDLYYGNSDWQVFALSALVLGGFSLAVALATHGAQPAVTPRFGFLLINMLWLTMAAAGALPLMGGSLNLSLTDALFEAVSAVTTTGSTVITGLDHLPPGILMWRSILNWAGGLGVIALGLFLLPFLKVGGVTYFKMESSDIQDRPYARVATFTLSIFGIYGGLTLLCALAYSAAGMGGFDSINHAMATLATGGFSTHDSSFGFFGGNYAILWVSTIFMFIGGLPFSILILFALRGRFEALRDPQILVYAFYTLSIIIIAAVYLRVSNGASLLSAVTHSAFNVVSIITTTGFVSDDYTLWGPFAVACLFVATFLGGCSGSTAGGIKAYRFLILFKMMGIGLRKLIYPNSVASVRYGDRIIDTDMQRAVMMFIASFLVIWAISTVLLAATGLDLLTSITGALTALTNVGPGFGDIIGPAGNFAPLPDMAKWILALLMLLGRLEILVVLIMFSPAFWRG
ncbi:TrkH family potassium uptake protein [Limoniibacter endophyticus]|uniref:Trk system potassium uptake protein n=1 Tax=Limoniibacter endophyticus TaxID=1565040 RepID=A0A8J3DDQ3_9HYPH|nr:TrkH family potassium uptake protein [Limoniibacter endophyticus]GHC60858.1 Trk system potassium uptake protein [Limoniibacter endophyticus]